MSKKITKTIELEYVMKGLDQLEKALKLVTDPSKLTEAGQKEYQKLASHITAVFEQAKLAQDKNLGPEGIKIIFKAYEDVFTQFRKTINKLFVGIGQDFREELDLIQENIKTFNENVLAIKKEMSKIEKDFKIDIPSDEISAKDESGSKIATTEGLKILQEKNQLNGEIFDTTKRIQDRLGQVTRSRNEILKLTEGSKNISKEELEEFLKTGQASQTFLAKLEGIGKAKQKNINIDRTAALIQEAHNAEQIGAAKILERYKELETQSQAELIAKKQEQQILDKTILDLNKETATEGKEEELKINQQLSQVLEAFSKIADDYNKVKEEQIVKERESAKAKKEVTGAVKEQETTFGKAAKQVFNYGIAFSMLRRVYRETLRTIRDLDSALTEMAVVTTMNREETWKLTGAMSELARETGFTISEISKLSTVYFRQGRVLSEVIELTRVAAMAARIAGISAAESADYLTSAVNAFQFSAQEALAVSDRFAALAAQSASSYEELAVGLSKFAAQANVAGVSIDFAMGLLAKGIETTREAPETIGTALKTVIARMRELTDLGKTFEDGMDISRVETALRQVGVALRDEQGQFRDLELVLQEIGRSWDTLTTNQRASVAVALAGTRQQSRLIAIMQDFDRTMELVNISQESAGATAAQHVQYMQGLEAATIRMQAAYQDFIKTIGDSETVIDIVNRITRVVDNLSAGLQRINSHSSFWTKALITIIIVTRSWIVVTKLANKQLAMMRTLKDANTTSTSAFSLAKIRETWAKKLNTAQTNLNTAAEKAHIGVNLVGIKVLKLKVMGWKILNAVMALNPVFLLIGGFAALTLLMGRNSLEAERNTKEFENNTKQMQANMFERRRAIRSIETIIEKMKEFNDLPFLTKAQQSELETLNEQLRELFGDRADEFMAIRLTDGSLDLVTQQLLTQQFIEENLFKQAQERLKLTKLLVQEQFKLNQEYLELEERLKNQSTIAALPFVGSWYISRWAQQLDIEKYLFDPEFSKTNLQVLGDNFVAELDILFDNQLSPATEDAFRRFLQVFDFSSADLDQMQTNLVDFIKDNFLEQVELIEEFSQAIDSELSLLDRYANFNEFFTQNLDSDLEDVLRRQIAPGLDYLSNKTPEFIEALENLNIASDRQIQQLGSIFGDNLPDVITLIEQETNRLQKVEGIPAIQAQEIAWSTLVGTIEDAEKAIRVYNTIFVGSFVDMANNLSQLNSQLERTRDIQSQWFEGTLGVQELARFFEDNPQLFQSMDDVNRFLSGESLTDSILLERLTEERIAISRLFDAERRLGEIDSQIQREGSTETLRAARAAILAEIAAYRSLTEYRGPLVELTTAQFNHNAELERYNRLSAIGAETTEDLERLLRAQNIAFEESAQRVDNNLKRIEERFSNIASEFGFGSNQLSDFFNVIGGQVVPVFENLEGLFAGSMEFLNELLEEYQENLDIIFADFEQRRETELNSERKLLDKQKRVYEDYFKAIDDLEKRRERQRDRESLVAQLSRLEGATDERSRRRALELRRELNQLDETTAEESLREAREALIESFDRSYELLEQSWAQMTQDFIDLIDGRGNSDAVGTSIANHFIEGVDHNLELEVGTEELNSSLGTLEEALSDFVSDLREIFLREERETFIARRTREIYDELKGIPYFHWGSAEEMAQSEAKNIYGFSKGGLVDYEGLAVLHGSKTSPEAVLSPSQTEMFIGLRDALQGLSFEGSVNSSINIENISISTASLNNNQDFKRAGESLADAFKSAIQRRGITVNTNRN